MVDVPLVVEIVWLLGVPDLNFVGTDPVSVLIL
jgi:hypothetical protein